MVDLNLLNEEQKWALLFGIMAGDGCLSHFVSGQKGEHFIISITGNYYDDKPFFREIVMPDTCETNLWSFEIVSPTRRKLKSFQTLYTFLLLIL